MELPLNFVMFKSTPNNYKNEECGAKPNTLRKIDENDDRFKTLRNIGIGYSYPLIIIKNTESGYGFVRKITDYTEYEGWAIISWDAFNRADLHE